MPIIINDNFEVNAPRSIDSRLVLDNLTAATTLDVNYNYPNMIVWIKDEKSFYYLKDGESGNNVSHWQLVEMGGTSGAGSSGTSGEAGTSGTSGKSGTSGTSGTSGATGTSGTSGVSGTSGTSGVSGTSGTSGASGSSGTSGVGSPGSSGTSGEGSPGSSGTSGEGSPGSSGTSGTSPIVSTNDVLQLNSGVLSTLYQTSVPDSVLSTAVGAAPATLASTWKTRNLIQVLDAILFQTQNPTYTIPTIAISPVSGFTNGQVFEVGASISPVLKTTGTENDAGVFTQLEILRGASVLGTQTSLSGVLTTAILAQHGYPDPNNPNYYYDYQLADTGTTVVPLGTTSYTGRGNYSAGLAKQDNFGNTDARAFQTRNVNAPQAASTNFTSSSISFTGVYPWYWGVSSVELSVADILALLNDPLSSGVNKVVADSSGTISVTNWGATGQYLWFATPETSTTKTIWYVNDSNTSVIGGTGSTNLFNAPSTQTVTTSRPLGLWTNISYKIYRGGYPTSHKDPGNLPAMQLRNT
jgi:hypothetical protein